jgi:hypothetical protein
MHYSWKIRLRNDKFGWPTGNFPNARAIDRSYTYERSSSITQHTYFYHTAFCEFRLCGFAKKLVASKEEKRYITILTLWLACTTSADQLRVTAHRWYNRWCNFSGTHCITFWNSSLTTKKNPVKPDSLTFCNDISFGLFCRWQWNCKTRSYVAYITHMREMVWDARPKNLYGSHMWCHSSKYVCAGKKQVEFF